MIERFEGFRNPETCPIILGDITKSRKLWMETLDKTPADLQCLLRQLAGRYIWWKSPEEALCQEDRVIAQVMDIGDFHDMEELRGAVGDDRLRVVLAGAGPGQFRPRSWHFWHYRLGLAKRPRDVPPLPERKFG